MDHPLPRGELKFAIATSGVLSVMMNGTAMMQKWFVNSLDTALMASACSLANASPYSACAIA